MRGKESDMTENLPVNRITPAYAGKRFTVPGELGKNQDHPRLCGEKHILLGWLPDFMGSPPPMRGKEITTRVPSY